MICNMPGTWCWHLADIFLISNFFVLKERCKMLPDYEEFFKRDVALEYTDGAMGYYIHALIEKGKEIQAVKLFKAFTEVMSEETIIPMSLLRSASGLVYSSSVLYPEEKIKILSNGRLWCSSVPFFNSLLLFEHGFKDHAFSQATEALIRTYNGDPYLGKILAEYFILCNEFKKDDCNQLFYLKVKMLKLKRLDSFEKELPKMMDYFNHYTLSKNVKKISKKFYFFYDEDFLESRKLLGMVTENFCYRYYKNY